MKNTKKFIGITVLAAVIVFGISVLSLTACGSKPAVSKVDELDAAIRDASNYLNGNIPNGSKIVILNIQSTSPDLSDYIIDELIANAVTDKIFSVVDRQQLDAIRAEQNFQLSGEVDDAAALEIGKFFGAQTIVSGALGNLGAGYRIRMRALEVQTAQVQGQYNRNIASSQLIAALIGGGSASSTGGTTATTNRTQAAAPAAQSGLTISGLSAYKDRYVFAAGSDALGSKETKLYIQAAEKVSQNMNYTAVKINGDSVTLNVSMLDRVGDVVKYNGNDKNIGFDIYIVNKAQMSKNDMFNLSSFLIARGTAEVSFSNGTGSGTFTLFVPPPPAPAYKVGDTGPAGGLIFYDKGNNSGGWRYLEAGPVDIEFIGRWRIRETAVNNTQANIGSGKRNTQLAVEAFKQSTGEWDTAAQKVVEIDFNGFKDWFIPSRDELDQMYGNLKRKNLGDFKNGWYMASTVSWNLVGSVYCQNFTDGKIDSGSELNIRPIRQVPGPAR